MRIQDRPECYLENHSPSWSASGNRQRGGPFLNPDESERVPAANTIRLSTTWLKSFSRFISRGKPTRSLSGTDLYRRLSERLAREGIDLDEAVASERGRY